MDQDPLEAVGFEPRSAPVEASAWRNMWTLLGPLLFLGGARVLAPEASPSITVPILLGYMFLGYWIIARFSPKVQVIDLN